MEKRKNTTNETEKQILTKLDDLIAAVLAKNSIHSLSIDHTLWNNAEVAAYIGVTYKYANEYIVTHHTFPNPVRLPNKNGKTGNPRWYVGEVIDWVAKYRER